MPRLNKVTLVRRQYKRVFVSKAEESFISPELLTDEIPFDVNVADTYPEVGCVNIQQDCHWFLARGTLPTVINPCDLGILQPETEVSPVRVNTLTLPGSVTYEVRPGKTKRLGFRGWLVSKP